MLRALTLLFLCQLAGEAVVRAVGLTFPSPVLGIGLLFAGLTLMGSSQALEDVTDAILRNLSLLFVPAAVGVVQQAGLIATHGLAIVVAVATSTVLTLLVTVLAFRAVARLQARGRP